MTDDQLLFCFNLAFGALVGALAPRLTARAGETFLRTNVNGRSIPAVLGWPLAFAGVAGATIAAISVDGSTLTRDVALALGVVTAVMFLAGLLDDTRGDERDRGFRGHLGALRRGRITGGILKIVAGLVAGALAGAIVADDARTTIEIAALVALSANAINLFDRAPGRAGKVALLAAVPLAIWGPSAWSAAAAGLLGALLVCLYFDLRERAMLGDAGANPLGAVLGLGLGLFLSETGRLVAIALLALLNLASERWSFTEIIRRTPALRAFDDLGRARADSEVEGSGKTG